MQLQWQEILVFYTVINSWSVFDIYIYKQIEAVRNNSRV